MCCVYEQTKKQLQEHLTAPSFLPAHIMIVVILNNKPTNISCMLCAHSRNMKSSTTVTRATK